LGRVRMAFSAASRKRSFRSSSSGTVNPCLSSCFLDACITFVSGNAPQLTKL
jgi:hypothetical protein